MSVNTSKNLAFLKYVGGKRWFIRKHSDEFPDFVNNYYEPFLGSGSIFFHLKGNGVINKQSFLNDINLDLICAFKMVKKSPQLIINRLEELKNSKQQYEIVKNLVCNTDLDRAVRYLYLNRTAYGGIYRVNKNGIFNVPYGNRKYKEFVNVTAILSASKLLKKKTKITNCSFESLGKSKIEENDFFCIDPPYIDLQTKFNRYNSIKFEYKDFEKLKKLLIRINKQKARYIVFVGGDVGIANSLLSYGDIKRHLRTNNLSVDTNGSIKIEYLVKNY